MKANYEVVTGSLERIPVNITRFPTGELAVKLDLTGGQLRNAKGRVSIEVQGYEPDTLFILANIKDALDEACLFSGQNIMKQLVLYYMPNARYDRHMVDGDGFALRVFCEMINLLKFDRVIVTDPHSDLTYGLLKNCIVVEQYSIMLDLHEKTGMCNELHFLVAPDAGALKKIYKLAEKVQLPVLTMNKVRDVKTGNITHTEILGKVVSNARYLIVDDICDGGYTFIQAAKALKNAGAGQVDLAVTHGIFSKGLGVLLEGGISNVYTTNTYSDFPEHYNLHQLRYFSN